MAKARRRRTAQGSAFTQLLKELRKLDTTHRAFDKYMRQRMRANPALRPLKSRLDRLRDAVKIPAYGVPLPKRR